VAIGVRYLCGNACREIAEPVTETKTGRCRRQALPKRHRESFTRGGGILSPECAKFIH
jgi:hypothetical protein